MRGLDTIRWGKRIQNIYFVLNDIIHYTCNKRKIRRFKAFFDEFYQTTPLISKEELQTCEWKWDLVISGSDQIWNPLLNNQVDPVYFGQFPNVKRKFSYASSFGTYKFDNDCWNKEIKKYLCDYDKISVRENADSFTTFLGCHVDELLDPTLLLAQDDWVKKLQIKKTKHDYVLVYAMNDFKQIYRIAEQLSRKLDFEVWVIGSQTRANNKFHYINDIGPKEFVELFYNAGYVVTNSFHGTAFAVNFRKNFSSVYNEKSPERVVRLLQKLNLQHYLVRDVSNVKLNYISKEEMKKAHYILDAERKLAVQFLKDY